MHWRVSVLRSYKAEREWVKSPVDGTVLDTLFVPSPALRARLQGLSLPEPCAHSI